MVFGLGMYGGNILALFCFLLRNMTVQPFVKCGFCGFAARSNEYLKLYFKVCVEKVCFSLSLCIEEELNLFAML